MRRALLLVLTALLLTAAGTSTDPLIADQWHLDKVGARAGWQLSRGGGVIVAVLDTGVDLNHPDLVGRLVNGIDLVEPNTLPDDANGHGTLVAGIISSTEGNGTGGAGVAPDVYVMPVRVLDANGSGTSDTVAEGIRFAVSNGADVINLSLADAPSEGLRLSLAQLIDDEVEAEIQAAADAGVTVVAAAGNDGEAATPYRASTPVLVVGASDREDRVWPASNRDGRTLFAPGVGIVGTYVSGSGYAEGDGTSFSTPVVSAGAALLRARGMTDAQTRDQLVATAAPIGSGLGRVDLRAALGAPELGAPPGPVQQVGAPPAQADPSIPVASEAPATPSEAPGAAGPAPSDGLAAPSLGTQAASEPAGGATDDAGPSAPLTISTGDGGATRTALVGVATGLLLTNLAALGLVGWRRRQDEGRP